jgi:hypothetical protein
MTPAELAALFTDPADAGRRAQAARTAHFGRRVAVRQAPPHAAPTIAALVRGAEVLVDAPGVLGHVSPDSDGDPGWPDPATLRPGDRVVVQVDHGRAAAYFAWLARAAAVTHEWSLAPFCARRGGLFRLHLLAAARIALPASARVEARHDLIGIRLAQVALGFGADVLAGPIARARALPLAGVTRPDEATPAGLSTLVEQAGLEPVLWDIPHEGAVP